MLPNLHDKHVFSRLIPQLFLHSHPVQHRACCTRGTSHVVPPVQPAGLRHMAPTQPYLCWLLSKAIKAIVCIATQLHASLRQLSRPISRGSAPAKKSAVTCPWSVWMMWSSVHDACFWHAALLLPRKRTGGGDGTGCSGGVLADAANQLSASVQTHTSTCCDDCKASLVITLRTDAL